MPCVEWKSSGDPAEGRWRAELAKQILGMANRDPDAAAAWFGGCAYILVGVGPGAMNGAPVHDSAKLEGCRSRRTSDGRRTARSGSAPTRRWTASAFWC